MANLKAIRRRIISVKNTQKITRAMKMVAAARLRKAQEAAEQFRAYADLVSQVLAEVASNASSEDHPLLDRREPHKSVVLVISADRGLCGGFNSSLCRESLSHIKQATPEPACAIIGRKAKEFFKHRHVTVDKIYETTSDDSGYDRAARIARELAERYVAKDVDRIEIIYNRFVSMISQKPTILQLLPSKLPERTAGEQQEKLGQGCFIFEPGQRDLLNVLLPKYLEVQVYRALLESTAAEHAARMTAMDAATSNAKDMLDRLTLEYNRARQSAITSDLMDIVGGAEALSE